MQSLQKTGRNLLEESVESSHAMTRHSTGERLQLLPGLCEGNVRQKDHSADTQGLGLEKSLKASTQFFVSHLVMTFASCFIDCLGASEVGCVRRLSAMLFDKTMKVSAIHVF